MKKTTLALGLPLLTFFTSSSGSQASAQTLLLDSFEPPTSLREINPVLPVSAFQRYLWNQCRDCDSPQDPGTQAASTEQAHDGTQALKITVTSGTVYMQFYPFHDATVVWDWLRQQVLSPAQWQFQTYNRLRFWMKVPPGIAKASGGDNNMHFGTYLRSSRHSTSLQESPDANNPALGHHWYHWYNIPYTGEWHQVIVDTSPEHQRDSDPNFDHGDQLNVIQTEWGDPWNYFDAMTRFYVDFHRNPSPYPAVWYFDGFELYRETANEDIDQVGSLNGVYVPATNTLLVGWTRHKSNSANHELRYAFQSIHTIGWNNALTAPGSPVAPLGPGGYNLMEWSTSAINVTGQSTIYIAIRPVNRTLFRQIAIPTGVDSIRSTAPPNLRVVP